MMHNLASGCLPLFGTLQPWKKCSLLHGLICCSDWVIHSGSYVKHLCSFHITTITSLAISFPRSSLFIHNNVPLVYVLLDSLLSFIRHLITVFYVQFSSCLTCGPAMTTTNSRPTIVVHDWSPVPRIFHNKLEILLCHCPDLHLQRHKIIGILHVRN